MDDPLTDLHLDHGREARNGDPEVVLATGKTPDQCARAVEGLLARTTGAVLVTRADPVQVKAILAVVPEAQHDEVGRVVVARRVAAERDFASVAVVTAGTSDLPVARECTATLDAFGIATDLVADVGVAGLHRVLSVRDRLDAAGVAVVVAGMEGALPTVVGSLVATPVIAVPTSVGYGATFEGLSALLGMLTSCAPGIAVVNIDSGFGAAMVARRILRTARRDTTAAVGTEAGA